MFRLELLQVHHILLIVVGFLVLGQVAVILFLGQLRLCLKGLAFGGSQALPIFTDMFGDLREGEVPSLELLTGFCIVVLVKPDRSESIASLIFFL